MSENSKIEWTTHTFNPWWGCAKISPGCDFCYAERDAKRFMGGKVIWGVHADRREFGDKHWNEPLKWNKKAQEAGERHRVFCASMADVFDKKAPEGARERLWGLIDATPNLDWLLLTKRIGNVASMLPERWSVALPENVWLGASIVNQLEADRDIPKLLQIKTKGVRFLSMEPLLGPVSLRWLAAWPENAPATPENPYGNGVTNHLDGLRRLDWVIVGGESGPHARPMHPKWAQDLRDQCEAAGVPFLFKQWGEYAPSKLAYDLVTEKILPNVESCEVDDAPAVAWPDGTIAHGRACDHGGKGVFLVRYGKKEAGRVLDGKIYNQFPREAHLESQ